MRCAVAAAIACLLPNAADGAERGCDKFAWPVETVRTLLLSADATAASSGVVLARPPGTALKVALATLNDARLPMPPERSQKAPYAGYLRIDGVPEARAYLVTLSAEAWIDVIQGGRYLKPAAFTGALDCQGIRKSVRFDLAAEPFVVQLSGATSNSIVVAITPADK